MRPAEHTSFVACRDCGLLQPVALHSRTAAAHAGEENIEAYADFVASHASHHMASFRRHGDTSVSDKPVWDPMAVMLFEATDGERTYVVRRARASIDEPRTYRFAPGALDVARYEVDVDDDDLRRSLDAEFFPAALRPTKIGRFIEALRDCVRGLAAEELEIAFDAADDPTVSVARMPDETFAAVLAACAEIFDPHELDRVHKFLHDNRDEDGVLALRIRRHVRTLHA